MPPPEDVQPEMQPAAPAGGADEAQADQELEQVLGDLQKERDDLEQRLLRLSADYQNFVRRSNQNIAATREQQTYDLAKALVTVLDHFDLALQVDPAKTPAATILQGVQMVRDELLRTLEGFGVKRMNPAVGQEFDPQRHEAMMRQKLTDTEPDRVAMTLQPGYTLGDKTIRPAKVAITE
jgi:molecular chaperone GrpE